MKQYAGISIPALIYVRPLKRVVVSVQQNKELLSYLVGGLHAHHHKAISGRLEILLGENLSGKNPAHSQPCRFLFESTYSMKRDPSYSRITVIRYLQTCLLVYSSALGHHLNSRCDTTNVPQSKWPFTLRDSQCKHKKCSLVLHNHIFISSDE